MTRPLLKWRCFLHQPRVDQLMRGSGPKQRLSMRKRGSGASSMMRGSEEAPA